MAWLSLVITLLLEQLRALPGDNFVYGTVRQYSSWAERNLNAGQPRHGLYAWLLVVLGLTLVVGAAWTLLVSINWFLGLALNVAVLYVSLGFRQFSHHGSEIQIALANGDLASARRELTAWKRVSDPAYSAADISQEEVVRQAIEHGLLLSQRHVFGVFFWFIVLPGPMGAVYYRLAEHSARVWSRAPAPPTPPDRFSEFARKAFAWIDWAPARLTALGYAIVGDFEGAIYCWRQVSGRPSEGGAPAPDARTLILAAASGATGLRLMSEAEATRYFDEAGNEGAGLAEPRPAAVRTVVGLVWRALLLWLALLLLLTLASWLA
ncbi:MAG TPA: CobD/CbiB family protein [Burkholderiaceae bacterium]|nr:CobD/CbiB family protein [Burkholderiaceae bacterium]HQR69544.1 CobD/CbiB family protein [Burkholderiaceae bacterium]